VLGHGGSDAPGRIVKDPTDFGNREAKPSKRTYAIQPLHVRRRVHPMSTAAGTRSDQQANLLVVPQRANRCPRRSSQLPDLVASPIVNSTVHEPDRGTGRRVTCNPV
jgi:hypothetical protein